MPDEALSAALREAFASAPADAVTFWTLELHHPAFSLPIRVVRDFAPLEARLEADAPRDPGALVTFAAYAFDLVPPEQTTDGSPRCLIEIDNVDTAILAALRAAAQETAPVEAILRIYLPGRAAEGPENIPPLRMELKRIAATPLRISAEAGFPDLLDEVFPRLLYDTDIFPGLAP
jgi:hypothetical protein